MWGILKKCSYLLVGAYVGLGEGANDGRPVVGFGVGIFGRYVGIVNIWFVSCKTFPIRIIIYEYN